MSRATKRLIVLGGSVLALLIVLSLAVPAVSRVIESTTVQDHELAAGVTALTLDTSVGEVTVRAAGPGEQPGARATITAGLSTPETDVVVDGDTVTISDTCSSTWWGNCSVDWDLVVPGDAALTISSDVGDVSVTDTTGPLTIASSVGEVSGQGLGSPEVTATSSVGDVTLTLVAPPDLVRVTSSTGDVSITVPDDGTDYRVEADTSVGDLLGGLGSDPSSTRLIDVRSSVGDVILRRG